MTAAPYRLPLFVLQSLCSCCSHPTFGIASLKVLHEHRKYLVLTLALSEKLPPNRLLWFECHLTVLPGFSPLQKFSYASKYAALSVDGDDEAEGDEYAD